MDVLVEAAKRVVVVPGFPKTEVHDAKQLQGLAKGLRRVAADVFQRLGQRLVACLLCLRGIAQDELLYGLKANDFRRKELLPVGRQGIILLPFLHFAKHLPKSFPEHRFVVRRDVAEVAFLMEVLRGGNLVPLLLGIDAWHLLDGPRHGNPFLGQQHGFLRIEHPAQPLGSPHLVAHAGSLHLLCHPRNASFHGRTA